MGPKHNSELHERLEVLELVFQLENQISAANDKSRRPLLKWEQLDNGRFWRTQPLLHQPTGCLNTLYIYIITIVLTENAVLIISVNITVTTILNINISMVAPIHNIQGGFFNCHPSLTSSKYKKVNLGQVRCI